MTFDFEVTDGTGPAVAAQATLELAPVGDPARIPASKVVAISAAVSAVFLGLAALLFGIARSVTAFVRGLGAARGGEDPEVQRPLSRLVSLLLIAGGVQALLLAGLMIGVLARIGDGMAVFG